MDEFLNARLQEVQEKLKPLLEKLGLTARLATMSWTGRFIEFVNEGQALESPVSIRLARRAREQHVNPWEGSSLRSESYNEIDIGKTGWKYLTSGSGVEYVPFDNDVSKTFAMIAEAIEEEELVRVGESHPNLTSDATFGEMYEFVSILASEVNAGPVRCERVEGYMSYRFEDDDGGDWRVAYLEREVVLSIDGAVYDTVSRHESDVRELIRDAIKDYGTRRPRM